MRRFCTVLLLSSLAPGALLAQQNSDGLFDIPQPGGMLGAVTTLPPIGAAPLVDTTGQTSPLVVPYQPEAESVPFFEFADEPTPGTPASGRAPGVLWPGDIRTPADEEPPTLGQSGIAHLLLTPEQVAAQDAADRAAAAAQEQARIHGGMLAQDFSLVSPVDVPDLGSRNIADLLESSDAGVNSFAPVSTEPSTGLPELPGIAAAEPPAPIEVDPHARFAFQDNPSQPDLPNGAMLMVPPSSSVQGRFASAGTHDNEWDASAAGLGVVRIDLADNMGGVTLVLGAEVPVFWGITTGTGTTLDGILLYGETATYSTFGAKTKTRERAPVVRRADLGKEESERLIRNGGGGVVAWSAP